jgi:hypothetical protein
MKSIFNKSLTVLIIVIILFFGLKGCIGTVYSNNEIKAYQKTTENGEIREIYLLPKNRLIISREYGEFFDVGLFEIKGATMTHYFGSFYNSGEGIFSVKIYPDILEAFKVEIRLIDSIDNIEETSFVKNDNKSIHYLLFKEKSVEFSGEYFSEMQIDKERYDYINALLKKLEK